jgi:hypothetical protein
VEVRVPDFDLGFTWRNNFLPGFILNIYYELIAGQAVRRRHSPWSQNLRFLKVRRLKGASSHRWGN